MYNIIVTIFVVVIIFIANKNTGKRREQKQTRYDAGGARTVNPVQGSMPAAPGRKPGVSGQPYATSAAPGRAMQKPPVSKPPVKKAEKRAESDVSTTDYLEQKAKQDQREHAKEKLEEQRRVNAKYGNRSVAGRYLLGDPVPVGCRIICCDYCNAENIVKIGYHSGLSCYFCRNHLEN